MPYGPLLRPRLAQPLPCPAGTYSEQLSLSNASQCLICPVGHYCQEGSSAKTPCAAGTIGQYEALGSPFLCAPCVTPTDSTMGSTTCASCIAEFYLDPLATDTSSATDRCKRCLSGASCPANSTLDAAILNYGRWRHGSLSRSISSCKTGPLGWSPCHGGDTAGDELDLATARRAITARSASFATHPTERRASSTSSRRDARSARRRARW